MGVPRFFLWLYKKYKNQKFILNKDDIPIIDSFLIDTNCLLHPQCFKILGQNTKIKNNNELERMMMEECISYLKFIIEFIDAKKEVYIAIDGVAPIAKIKQQRQRRFSSVNKRKLDESIKRKHKKEIATFWNNSAITPGTEFMKKLTEKIIEFCKTYETKVKIYFSTANTPGEGEHKLLQYIRKSNNDYKYVIYGLDADLIFLALAANKDNIFLLRESQEVKNLKKDISETLSYISIDTLKLCIVNEIKNNLYDEFVDRKLDEISIIKDFIFICYFLGNDFLPHIPSIDISCFDKKNINGLDLLLQAYCHTYDNLESYLICDEDDISYNTEFLQMFLEYLSTFEDQFFKILYDTKKFYRKLNSEDAYEKEVYRIENLQFKIEDPIELGKDENDEYKFRYYKKYYNSEVNQNEIVKYACYKYIEGLIWVAKYYFKDCPSWDWYYPFDHAPFISDIADNFKRFNMSDFKFELGKPLNPLEQLCCVLPPQSSFLLPLNMRWIMNNSNSELIHLYPIKFELDLLYKDKYWQAIPILPDLDIQLVKKVILKYTKKNVIDNNVLEFN